MTRKTSALLILLVGTALVAAALLYLGATAQESQDKDRRHIQPWQYEHRSLVPANEELGTIDDIAASLHFPDDVTTAMLQLSNETIYATGLIGEAAIIPPSETHFQTIVSQPSAFEIFLSLYYARGATNEGRMQALRGLWHVDLFAYDEIVPVLKDQDIGITVMHGCIVEVVAVGVVLEEIQVQPLSIYSISDWAGNKLTQTISALEIAE